MTRRVPLGANFKPENYNIKFNKILQDMYNTESLNLIGAFQDGTDLQLLLFKLDKQPTEPIDAFTESYIPT